MNNSLIVYTSKTVYKIQTLCRNLQIFQLHGLVVVKFHLDVEKITIDTTAQGLDFRRLGKSTKD